MGKEAFMEFIRTDKLTFDPRAQMSRVFVEGFYMWLKRFSKDKEKLAEVFAHVFSLEYFFAAVEGREIAAMTACTGGFSPICLNRREFARILGFFRGNITFFNLRRHMIRNSYPFALGKKTGSIEFVATAQKFQNQGLGYELISYVMKENPYETYVLEVADTNAAAVRLYEKLGFKEMKRVKAPKKSGVNFFIYMRKERT